MTRRGEPFFLPFFGELITTEPKTLNKKKLLVGKYEIQTVIFNILVQVLEPDTVPRASETQGHCPRCYFQSTHLANYDA